MPKRNLLLLVCLAGLLLTTSASANLCSNIRTDSAPTDSDSESEANLHEQLFPQTQHWGNRDWNRKLLICNRKRDTNGNKIKQILTDSAYQLQKDKLSESDLPMQLIKGKYNFFGNVVTQQKYRYVLSKSGGEWTMTIPYDAEINDVVPIRVDIYMGELSTTNPNYSPTDRQNHAWHLYEFSQLDSTGIGPNMVWTLKPDAQPIAETHCSSTRYYAGKEGKYDGQDGLESKKRDRTNRHISEGLIQYSYNDTRWKTGCRIDMYTQIAWHPDTSSNVVESPTSADTWVKRNFIRTAESYWSQPDSFRLRLLLKGFNEDEFSPELLNLLGNNDYLQVRFGTKFMPYGSNQVYKTSLIQFNNFSTMTTDGTLWHEVGHAFGLDDEYGGADSDNVAKDNGCESSTYSSFSPTSYQMCDAGETRTRSIYHYIATSRYVLSQICSDDSDCDDGQYCNNRAGLNRCLADGSSQIGDACFKNKECDTNRCQGSSGNKQCVCADDGDCENGRCIVGTFGIGKNYCRATAVTSCPSGWTYETRNPSNRDRCNRTVVETGTLECKLGAGNRARNWTGPHAQAGSDECRSTKGKSPKGVKCPSRYTHNILPGADTCTRRVTERRTPTCPVGWDYRSQRGRDICQDS